MDDCYVLELTTPFQGEVECVGNGWIIYDTDHSIRKKVHSYQAIRCDEIHINIPHVLTDLSGETTYIEPKEQISYQCDKGLRVNCSCITPSILKCPDLKYTLYKNVAELGVRWGSSSKYILDNFSNLEHLTLFERKDSCCEVICKRLNQYHNWTLFAGDAAVSLHNLSTAVEPFDFVFVDLSHKFNIDKLVIDQLVPFVNTDTVIWFDDEQISDVIKLKEYAKSILNCRII